MNAHPHGDENNHFVIVHNGIIENYMDLKKDLLKKGHVFKSETDSEVVAHLAEELDDGVELVFLDELAADLLVRRRGAEEHSVRYDHRRPAAEILRLCLGADQCAAGGDTDGRGGAAGQFRFPDQPADQALP